MRHCRIVNCNVSFTVLGAMNLDRTKIVALDWTYRDPELMKRMEENVQIRKVLFKLLKEYVLPAAENGKLKIVLL